MKKGINVFFGEDALKYCQKFADKAECRKVFHILREIRSLKGTQRPFPFLSGLHGTGKTAMLYAAMASIEDVESIVYITFNGTSTTEELGQYLKIFMDSGHYASVNEFIKNQWNWQPATPEVEDAMEICFGGKRKAIRHVFIDNLENVEDFTRNSKWISDVFRYTEPQLVFAGLPFTVDRCLADCFMGEGISLDMNFLSFRDWSCQTGKHDPRLYLKEGGPSHLGSGAAYLDRMLDDFERAAKGNISRHGCPFGSYYELNALYRRGSFRQAAMGLLNLNVLRQLHDVVIRHFAGCEPFRPLYEKILQNIMELQENLANLRLDTGEATEFFNLLDSLGIFKRHRVLDLRNYEAKPPLATEADMWLAVLYALERIMDPAEGEKVFEILKEPVWLPRQPALGLNLGLHILKRMAGELKDKSIYPPMSRKVRANALLSAVLVNAYAACPKKNFGDKGWDLESIRTRWGFIDLVDSHYGEKRSEVFVMAATAVGNPERMLTQPGLRALLESRYYKSCKYFILYDGESHEGADGIVWLNLAEFLETLPERWRGEN